MAVSNLFGYVGLGNKTDQGNFFLKTSRRRREDVAKTLRRRHNDVATTSRRRREDVATTSSQYKVSLVYVSDESC